MARSVSGFSQPLRGYVYKCLRSIYNGGSCSLHNCCPCGDFRSKYSVFSLTVI